MQAINDQFRISPESKVSLVQGVLGGLVIAFFVQQLSMVALMLSALAAGVLGAASLAIWLKVPGAAVPQLQDATSCSIKDLYKIAHTPFVVRMIFGIVSFLLAIFFEDLLPVAGMLNMFVLGILLAHKVPFWEKV